MVLILVLAVPGRSFALAMTAPGNLSPSEKAVEWLRDNGFDRVVNGVENWWYSSHPPKRGGLPSRPITAVAPPGVTASMHKAGGIDHTPRPADVVSPAPDPLPNEGRWMPVGPRTTASR